jgi:UDP-glucuronate decarboxylase
VVDIRVARIFNTYGPWMASDDGRVISNFICQGISGENLTIYGSGSQTRSICYVDDLIQGFMTLMASDVREPVNIGNHIDDH